MDIEIAFTGVPVSDLSSGRDFFERIFGRAADVEVAVDEVMWRVAETAWLYVVVDSARLGTAWSHSPSPTSMPRWPSCPVAASRLRDGGCRGGRKATVLDPDGNSVAILQVPA